MIILSSELIDTLRAAGWFDGRRVAVDADVPSDHPAHQVLAEFGGLKIVRDDIVELDFQHVTAAKSELEPWADALRTRLVGIAEAHNGHGSLYMTDKGHVLGASIIHPACWFDGRSIEETITRVLTGTRSRPMLLPEQSEVMLYGKVFRHGDSTVVTPASPELKD